MMTGPPPPPPPSRPPSHPISPPIPSHPISPQIQISEFTANRHSQTAQLLLQVSELEAYVEKLTNENSTLKEENRVQMEFITELEKFDLANASAPKKHVSTSPLPLPPRPSVKSSSATTGTTTGTTTTDDTMSIAAISLEIANATQIATENAEAIFSSKIASVEKAHSETLQEAENQNIVLSHDLTVAKDKIRQLEAKLKDANTTTTRTAPSATSSAPKEINVDTYNNLHRGFHAREQNLLETIETSNERITVMEETKTNSVLQLKYIAQNLCDLMVSIENDNVPEVIFEDNNEGEGDGEIDDNDDDDDDDGPNHREDVTGINNSLFSTPHLAPLHEEDEDEDKDKDEDEDAPYRAQQQHQQLPSSTINMSFTSDTTCTTNPSQDNDENDSYDSGFGASGAGGKEEFYKSENREEENF